MPGGYDHNYVLSGPNALRAASAAPAKLSVAAWVHEPKSGRIMELLTDAPGLQFYTGEGLKACMHDNTTNASPSPSPCSSSAPASPKRSWLQRL